MGSKPRFLSTQLKENPGNPLERMHDLRLRVEELERLLISPDAADARYARIDQTGFFVHKNGTNQTGVAASTWTKVTWATEAYDRLGDFDLSNSKFIVAETGEYLLGATINWSAFTSGAISRVALYKNGVAAWHGPLLHSSSTSTIGASVQVLASLNVGDEIELYAQQTSTGSQAILGDATLTYWWGVRMF